MDQRLLAPYLPRLAIEWLADPDAPAAQEIDGSVVFVDISGFTKLSEHVARRGRVGAEDLADAIGGCFTELLAVAYAEGSSLLKFGGDALLLLFTDVGHEARACAAAVGMRRQLRSAGRIEVPGMQVRLRMSIGVNSGRFHFFFVGGSHRELVVTGPAATQTIALEAAADAGEILVGAATAAALRPSSLGPAKGPGRLLRRAPALGAFAPWVEAPQLVDLEGGISIALKEHLLSDANEAEHRLVTVAFIRFEGTDQLIDTLGPAEVAQALEQLVCTVQVACDRRGVAFLGTDIDRDGGKIILTSGAPTSSGDDERRMLVALREVLDARCEIPVRVGANRGAVFAGDVGPAYRRTYTVMGDAVNLAARLMAKAEPGQLLATREVVDHSAAPFETHALEPFLVKGKTQPIEALRIGDAVAIRSSGSIPTTTFVGRESELGTLLEAAAAAQHGRGSLVEIVGEPGLGKSRLVDELRRRAVVMDQLTMACEDYESTTSYHPFRAFLREVLGIPADTPLDEAVDDLTRQVAEVSDDLLPWLPLVAALMELPVADTPETAELDPRFRAARLGRVMGTLLSRRLSSPTLLIVEDAHWMDDASAELFHVLMEGIQRGPWLVCVTRRDQPGGYSSRTETATTMRLLALATEDATKLVHEEADSTLAPHEIDALTARAAGNPLYLRELLDAARTAGGVGSLPDSLEALLTARIDRLVPADRALLRRASVLGRVFPSAVLRAVVDDAPDDDDRAWERVSGLLRREGDQVVFDHALVRDAAYETLSFRLRRELHARAGDAIGALAGDRLEDQAALLSLHYFHAERFDAAWSVTNTAAERATSIYANIDALELYERALSCARHLPELDPVHLARVHESLGDIRSRLGDYTTAETAYRAARRRVHTDRVADARLMLRLAWVVGWRDGYSRALRWITRALRSIEDVTGDDARGQRAQLLAWYAQFCQEGGDPTRASRWSRKAVEEAEGGGRDDALAHALKVLGWAEMDRGRFDDSTHLDRALELYETLDDLAGQMSVLNLLGGFAYWRGEWGEALDRYEQARDMAHRTGDMVFRAFCAANIGEIALDQGHVARAEELFRDAWRVWRAAGDRPGAAYAKCNLARAAVRSGRLAEALALFEDAQAESRAVGAQADAFEARARMAEGLLIAGEVATSVDVAEAALGQMRATGGVAAQNPLLHRVRGAAFLRRGDPAAARAALEESLAAARARQSDYEVALTLEILAEAAARAGDDAYMPMLEECRVILGRLEVVSTPDLLGDHRNLGSPAGRRSVSTTSPA